MFQETLIATLVVLERNLKRQQIGCFKTWKLQNWYQNWTNQQKKWNRSFGALPDSVASKLPSDHWEDWDLLLNCHRFFFSLSSLLSLGLVTLSGPSRSYCWTLSLGCPISILLQLTSLEDISSIFPEYNLEVTAILFLKILYFLCYYASGDNDQIIWGYTKRS